MEHPLDPRTDDEADGGHPPSSSSSAVTLAVAWTRIRFGVPRSMNSTPVASTVARRKKSREA
ncbi:hypothetical protein [Geodermatophilus sp. URMC 62]|uniref:hypothetical protein n=1 Tax=Geodermatophilus sp. URMC 62 TaxID=3423414 RepID=UPI00406D30F0